MNVLLCPLSDPGYLYPAIAAGIELRDRGHHVSVLVRSSSAPVVAGAGLPVLVAEDYGGQGSFNVVRWILEGAGQYRAISRAAKETHADVLVTSVLCNGALLAAETRDLPVVVLGFAAHLWNYQAGGEAEPAVPAARAWRSRVCLHYYRVAREQAGLADRPYPEYPLLGTALLLRGDPALEYPRALLPQQVSHVGPCSWEPAADPAELEVVAAHLDRIGKPLVYVHLGRVFGGTSPWPRLNAAFTDGPFQAVVEQGRSKDPLPEPGADLLIVRKPWMGPLIDRAGLVLTTGTSAPVLTALLRGRPLGMSPAGSEQPLLTEACVRAGVAVRIPADAGQDPAGELWSAWHDHQLRAAAEQLGQRLAQHPGPALAADAIERAAKGRVSAAPMMAPALDRPAARAASAL